MDEEHLKMCPPCRQKAAEKLEKQGETQATTTKYRISDLNKTAESKHSRNISPQNRSTKSKRGTGESPN